MKQASIIYRRRSSGSMLILVSITILILVAVFMLCFTLHNLLFQRGRCQQDSDSFVVGLADGLNINDAVSQVNELEARSRELVFDTRRQLNEVAGDEEVSFIAPLCDRFMMEAREGHDLVERERKSQIAKVCRELCREAVRHNAEARQRGAWSFAGVSAEQTIIERIEVGRIAAVETNVPATRQFEELLMHDRERGYLHRDSNLFKAGVNAKLPGEDSDLDFMMSGIPACVGGVTATVRNVNSDVFIPLGKVFENGEACPVTLTHLPNAVRVSSAVATDIAGKHQTSVKIYSVGASSGANSALD